MQENKLPTRYTITYRLLWDFATVITILIFLIAIPFDFIFTQIVKVVLAYKDSYKQLLTMLPEQIRIRLNSFDSNGLKHNKKWLEENKKKVALMTRKEQANFADFKCIKMAYVKLIDSDHLEHMKSYEFNTTAIGNMAYLYLYGSIDELQKAKINSILTEIEEYYLHF